MKKFLLFLLMGSKLFAQVEESHEELNEKISLCDCLEMAIKNTELREKDEPPIGCEWISDLNGEEKIGALEILSNQVNLLKNEVVGENELEKVKACSLSHTRLSYEKCAKRCLRYGEDLILSKNDKILSIHEEEEIYKNITSKEIMELANEIFDFNKCSICISGHLDKEKVDELIKSKKLFANK